jgi:hypothetical protein
MLRGRFCSKPKGNPMSKNTYYVFSTLTAPQVYTRTGAGGSDLPRILAQVYIAGGSNIPDKYLRTPIGVMTEVSDEEMTLLEENEVFQLHRKNGFIKVEKKPADPEKVAADMTTRDDAAPLVEQDFSDNQKPKTNTDPDNASKPPAAPKNSRKA